MITRLEKKHHKVRFPVNWHAELSDRTDPLRKATSHTQANKKIKKGDLVQVETDKDVLSCGETVRFHFIPRVFLFCTYL